MAAQELTWKVSVDAAIAKAALADVRREVAQTSTATQNANKSELSMRQQLAAASSLQRQRSSALITEWKRTERAAADLARGVGPVKDNLQKITDIMQTLGASSTTLAGSMNGVSSRLRALGSIASEAGGGLGLAGVGIAGLVAAVAAAETLGPIILTKQFLDLTSAVTEFQGRLLDMSQQTGVSVETLSALEVVAKTTGTDIESLGASLGIFQKNLESATQDAEGPAAKAFKNLGVNITDTEDSLRQTIKALSEMPEGFEQTSAALEVFGRGGKAFLAIAKESNGSLDELIAKMTELGVIVSTTDAKAADEFNDQLAILQFQVRGLTALVAKDAVPAMVKALKDVSQVLKDNQDAINALGSVLNGFVQGNLSILTTGLNALTAVLNDVRAGWYSVQAAALAAASGLDYFTARQAIAASAAASAQFAGVGGGSVGVSALAGVQGGFSEPQKRSGGGGKSAAEKISEGQRLLNQLTEEYTKLQDKEEKLTRVQIVAKELLDKKYKTLTASMRDQILTEAAQIDRAKATEDLEKRKADATEKIRALLNSQTEAIKKATLGDDEYADQITALEAELKKLGLTMDDNTKKLLTDNAATQKALTLTRERIVLEETRIKLLERQRAVEKENQDRLLGIEHSEGDETRARSVNAPIKDARTEVDKLFDSINANLSGAKQTAALAGLQAMTGAFDTLGQAIGQAAYAWVLYGNSGTSIRKITAEILASVAQQALVKSIFELAEGFAALFLNPAEAAAHFTAAAIYASIGGIAAVTGRAVAGNAFQQSTGKGSSGGPAGSASGGSATANKPATIKEEWRQTRPIVIQIHGEAGEAFNYKVLGVIDRDFDINGSTARRIKVETNK
jgi:hypothetical protein